MADTRVSAPLGERYALEGRAVVRLEHSHVPEISADVIQYLYYRLCVDSREVFADGVAAVAVYHH